MPVIADRCFLGDEPLFAMVHHLLSSLLTFWSVVTTGSTGTKVVSLKDTRARRRAQLRVAVPRRGAVPRFAYVERVQQLLGEIRRMPDASIAFARGLSNVWTPDDLVPLRERVRLQHHGEFQHLQAAINERFGTTGATDNFLNVFYAAVEMALMELVARDELSPGDRARLRQLWEALLNAR